MHFTDADRNRIDALIREYRKSDVDDGHDPEWLEGFAQHLYDLSVALRDEAFYAD